MKGVELDMWVNEWLHDVYGLDDDDLLNAGQVEEIISMAIYDFQKRKKKPKPKK